MTSDVRHYYDHNTRFFLRSGGDSQRSRTMHRVLRVPGAGSCADRTDAVHGFVADAIDRQLHQADAPEGASRVVADLGCGVGATMRWMKDRTGAEVVGITVSEVQARIARDLNGERGNLVVGSFESPDDLRRMSVGRPLDAAYMIESFVHATEPEALFRAVAAVCRPGAVLAICDDFASDSGTNSARTNRMVREFREGWHATSFITAEAATAIAQRSGWRWVDQVDLTPYVVTTRPRDVVARMLSYPARALGAQSPMWRNVIGGSALQRLIRSGAARYQLLVFRRSGDDAERASSASVG